MWSEFPVFAMVEFLRNPANLAPKEALVTFSHEDLHLFRPRFSFTTATTAPVITRAGCSFYLNPMSLTSPLTAPRESSSTGAARYGTSLVYPTGPAPTDAIADGTGGAVGSPKDFIIPETSFTPVIDDATTVTNRGAYNQVHYGNSYLRHFVESTTYRFEIHNYEDVPLICGYEILPVRLTTHVDSAGDPQYQSMVDWGAEVPVALNTLRLDEVRARENVVVASVPPGMATGRMVATTTTTGASADAKLLHVNPGKGYMEFTVHNRRILNEMARSAYFNDPSMTFDADFHCGAYGTSVSDCTDAQVLISDGYTPFSVQVFFFAPDSWYTDFQGTSATADDHWNGLHYEGWGTTSLDWAAKINIKPRCTQLVRLLDPVIPGRPTTTDPDIDTSA